MQEVSKAYKSEMQKIFRDHSYMKVTIGLINHEAQTSAYVPDADMYGYDSNLEKPFDNYEVNELYASTDNDYITTDGSMYFMPRDKADVVLNQGIISKNILGEILIKFDKPYELKGLTVDFGKSYPVDFEISSDSHKIGIRDNHNKIFTTEEIFRGATYIKIAPLKMLNGSCRLRVHKITMGIGVYFDSKQIISATKKEYVSPIMEELPTLDFDLVIGNKDRVYDVENEKSSVHFLHIGQKISVIYGQELDSGQTEWRQGATAYLKEWSADDRQMSFKAVDRFESLREKYYRGTYSKSGISLYDMAVDVLNTAGVDTREYELDEYLKKVIVHNPLPIVSYAEALQLIANAGRCVLGQDRYGKIFIRSSFLPDMESSSDNAAYYSKTEAVLNGRAKQHYVDTSLNLTNTIGKRYFLPKEGGVYLETGYVSEACADSEGLFLQNPSVKIQMEAKLKLFGMQIHFGENHPKGILIRSYLGGTEIESYETEVENQKINIEHEFVEADSFVIEVVKGRPFNRVEIDNIIFGRSTDYWLRYGTELSKTPKGTQVEDVRELQIVRTVYTETEPEKELTKFSVSAGGEYTIYFNSPSYDIHCTADKSRIELIYASSYSAAFRIDSACEVRVLGKEYKFSKVNLIKALNPSGALEEWENPLISEVDHASDLADWIGNYMKSDRLYDISYRGDPRIDANDIMYLENKYVPELLLRVYEHTLKYNGALSGQIKARRDIEYVADA